MLSDRVHEITYDPFCFFHVTDYLPPEKYSILCDSFPNDEWFVQVIEGDKRRFSSSGTPEVFREFCRKYPVWQELFETFASQAIVDDIHALVRRGLVESRGRRGLRAWCDGANAGMSEAIAKQPVKVVFEFSRLEKGSFVPPHTDGTSKLVSLMLYFPHAEWDESYGGSTVFYRPKNPAANWNWHNRRVAFEDVVPFHVNKFVPNKLVGFLKSKNSYHGVPPIICPPGTCRNSLNINVLAVRPKTLRQWDKFTKRLGHRLESLRFDCR